MKKRRKDTHITHGGRDPAAYSGMVNVPVHRTSTVVFPNMDAFEAAQRDRFNNVVYGRMGTPSTTAFEEALAGLEGGDRSIAVSSGLAAIAVTLSALLKSGDHLLMVDTVYGPARIFCGAVLEKFGVDTTFYDPLIGAEIEQLIRPNTKLIFLECPGSLTMEVQDVPAIVAVAKARGILTAADNTWASPYFFRPLQHGVDVSIQAATKYIVGHSDAMLGAITVGEELHHRIKTTANLLGNCPGTEELYLGLRGLRTLGVRLRRHQESALEIAQWLAARSEVARVLYPALPGDAGHEIWRRDFDGASGLLSMILRDVPRPALHAFVDAMKLFGLGASFGGYESLVLVAEPERFRSATTWAPGGPTVRLHIGLEDVADLKADLDQAFAELNKVAREAA